MTYASEPAVARLLEGPFTVATATGTGPLTTVNPRFLVYATPALGPTSTLLVHRLACDLAATHGQPITLNPVHVAQAMGLSRSNLVMAVARAVTFGYADVNVEDRLLRIAAFVGFTDRQLAKMPPDIRQDWARKVRGTPWQVTP